MLIVAYVKCFINNWDILNIFHHRILQKSLFLFNVFVYYYYYYNYSIYVFIILTFYGFVDVLEYVEARSMTTMYLFAGSNKLVFILF